MPGFGEFKPAVKPKSSSTNSQCFRLMARNTFGSKHLMSLGRQAWIRQVRIGSNFGA